MKKAADLARTGEVYYEHPVPAPEQEFRGTDVPRILATIRWWKVVRLQNVSLDTAETRALVSAMGNKITNVELGWNSGDTLTDDHHGTFNILKILNFIVVFRFKR